MTEKAIILELIIDSKLRFCNEIRWQGTCQGVSQLLPGWGYVIYLELRLVVEWVDFRTFLKIAADISLFTAKSASLVYYVVGR